MKKELIINDCNRPLAIVMGRLYTTRLTLVRAAGMVGCDVVLIQTHKIKNVFLKIDGSSKYVIARHHCPEPNENALIETILRYCGKGRKIVLLPADDWVASVLDRHYEQLDKLCFVPNVDNKQGGVLRLMDKDLQKNIARKIGANVAKGWLCVKSDGVYHIPDGVTYPCFTKPQESYTRPLKHLQKKCNDRFELEETLLKIARIYNKPILVEEFVEITKEYGVQGATFEGKAIAPSAIEKSLSRRGITASGKIFPIKQIPNIQDKVTAFLKETKMTGIFDIEFYESHGKLYFNEFNVRLGANGFALTYGIYNIPGLYIKYRFGESEGEYVGPTDFKEKSFVSEKVVRDIYYEEQCMSFLEYKRLVKNADILCVKYDGDKKPYKVFVKWDFILPLKKKLRTIRRRVKR